MVAGGMAEWSMAVVLKTARVQALVGSNPTPSATIPIQNDHGDYQLSSLCRCRSGRLTATVTATDNNMMGGSSDQTVQS